MNKSYTNGFAKIIILILIAIIALGWFGFDLRSIVESPQVQKNLQYAWTLTKSIWTDHIVPVAKKAFSFVTGFFDRDSASDDNGIDNQNEEKDPASANFGPHMSGLAVS